MELMIKKQVFIMFFLTTVPLILMCCGTSSSSLNKKTSYKEYYYPIKDLTTPKVYHFTADDEKSGDLYWVLSTVSENGKSYLLTDSYTKDSLNNLKHVEVIKEEINEKGAFVKEYIESQYSKNGVLYKSPAIMENECVFQWDLKGDKEIIWKFINESKIYRGYKVETERVRKFVGITTEKLEYNNESISVAKFIDNFKITYINTLNSQKDIFYFEQTSFYAKGIGLYKYIRTFPDSKVTLTLIEILTLSEWEKIKKI